MSRALATGFAFLLCFGLTAARPALTGSTDPTATANGSCQSRVEIFGYKCEEHTVTTEDGYILSLQRIPNGRSGESSGTNKISVLLQHGLIMAYWNWSWDELASHDLSATVQYVYNQVGQQKIHYVGHSLGTLMALASFSQQKLVGQIRSAALLSPIAFMDRVSSPLARAAADSFLAETIYWLGVDEFDPAGKAVHDLLTELCKQPGINCYDLMAVFTGDNCCLDNSSVQVFLDHEPQASATKNMIHLAQMIRQGKIAKYDYGDDGENMEHYGQTTPPIYNLSAIPNDLPLFLGYGGRDALSDVQDVHHLFEALKSHDGDKLTIQYLEDYAHADFVMAVNAKQRVYGPLMAFFKLQEK